MPNIFINELSAVGQASHPAAADELMHNLAITYEALKPITCGGALYRHSTFGACRLTADMTVYEWLRHLQTGQMRTVQQLLLDVVTKRPKIDTWLAEHVPNHTCRRAQAGNVSYHPFSSLAGAAHMGGWLISIRDCEDFPSGGVEVDYSEDDIQLRATVVEHFVDPAEARARRRIYQVSDKHKATPGYNSGVRIAPMDLKPEAAQLVLDCAQSIPGEKRVFARHGRKIYVFFEHTPRHYHGYSVENPHEYQSRDAVIYNHLSAWDWVE